MSRLKSNHFEPKQQQTVVVSCPHLLRTPSFAAGSGRYLDSPNPDRAASDSHSLATRRILKPQTSASPEDASSTGQLIPEMPQRRNCIDCDTGVSPEISVAKANYRDRCPNAISGQLDRPTGEKEFIESLIKSMQAVRVAITRGCTGAAGHISFCQGQ